MPGGSAAAPGERASRPRENASPCPPLAEFVLDARSFVGVGEGVVTGRPRQQQQISSVENVLLSIIGTWYLVVNYEKNTKESIRQIGAGRVRTYLIQVTTAVGGAACRAHMSGDMSSTAKRTLLTRGPKVSD